MDAKAKLDSDEVEWIGTTRYFQLYFVEGDVSPSSWPDEYWTRTQPMVARYAIGSWLWLRGYDLKSLDPTYDWTKNQAVNRRAGLGPSDALLADGRVMPRILAALSVLMLYLVIRMLAGPVGGVLGGLTAAGLSIGSPYLQENLVRAKAESTLMFLLLAALLLAVVGLKRAGRSWPGAGWGILAGIFLGLAFGAKLTAVLAIVAVALWGAGASLYEGLGEWRERIKAPIRRARNAGLARLHLPVPQSPSMDLVPTELARPVEPNALDRSVPIKPPTPRGRPWVWPATVLVTTALVFLASNPFLWPDPVGRTWLLFENRQKEMADQQQHVPSRAVHDIERRVALVWERSLWNDAYGPSRVNLPLEAILAVVGAGWLILCAGWKRRPGPEALVLLWLAGTWVGVTIGLGFLLQHYFVPTAMVGTLLAGLAVGWIVEAAWSIGRRSLAALPSRPLPAPVPIPAPVAVTLTEPAVPPAEPVAAR